MLRLKLKKTGRNYLKQLKGEDKSFLNTAFIALGSNMGDRINYIKAAIARLSQNSKIKMVNPSSVYETKPLGSENQSNFLNAVIKVRTSFELIELFDYLKKLEIELGRKKSTKWGPRKIDLDLLFFNDVIFENELVTVPHYGIEDRDFVLIPLKEIASDYFHPALKQKISDICTEDISKTIIRKTKYKIS